VQSTTDLMQNVYANFLGAYSGGAASNDAVLAFEPLGLMPGIDPAAPGAASTALEYMSSVANALPDLSGGVFTATERTVAGAYLQILDPAQPLDPSAAAGFSAIKAAAMEAYQNGAQGSLLGPYTYYPAFAAPANWYDPAVQNNWTSYAYSAGSPPPPANPRFRMMNTSAQWRITTSAPPTQQPPATQSVQSFMAMPATQPQTRFAPRPVPHPAPQPAGQPQTHFTPPSGFVRPSPAQTVLRVPPAPTASPSAAPARPPLVVNNDGAAPTLHPFFNIAFEYCVVQLRRPWKSGDFLASSGWFVPGAHVGDFASGPVGARQATAALTPGSAAPPAETGSFAWIPVACIAVRNLVINAGGGAIDPTVGASATALGPFRVAPSASGVDSLRNPGIQIIAWICNAQPLLPPASDPALIPPASLVPQDTSTKAAEAAAIDVAAGILGGLLNRK
jgi:hypothetical protein